ncbi:S1 RNA-binding domain-containing protein [Streptococcus pneumoniae]|nr:S1 RNA-binding domain-containing protein [Streptococcus pneumoniae]VMS20934.1 S1 RNA-binding domain-containing protein [Streptococcus pneumoniae]VNR02638.1 S1 RNA-binding domain-containing protein [Streptococcus pneumoniae]
MVWMISEHKSCRPFALRRNNRLILFENLFKPRQRRLAVVRLLTSSVLSTTSKQCFELTSSVLSTTSKQCFELTSSVLSTTSKQCFELTSSVLSATSKQCFELTSSVLSTTSKRCFEQPVASFLVYYLIFIEYKELGNRLFLYCVY